MSAAHSRSYIEQYFLSFLLFRAILLFFTKIAYNKSSKRKDGIFMIVTATEFKTNFGKYLEMIAKEERLIPAKS